MQYTIRFLMAHVISLSLTLNAMALENEKRFTPNELSSIVNIINSKLNITKDLLPILKKSDLKKAKELEIFLKENPQIQNQVLPKVSLHEGKLFFVDNGKFFYISMEDKNNIQIKSEEKSLELESKTPFEKIPNKIIQLFKTKKEFSFIKTFLIEDSEANLFTESLNGASGGSTTAGIMSTNMAAVTAIVVFLLAIIALEMSLPLLALSEVLKHAAIITIPIVLMIMAGSVIGDTLHHSKCDFTSLTDGISTTGKLEYDLLGSKLNPAEFCTTNPQNDICVHAHELKKCQDDNTLKNNSLCQRLDELKKCLQNQKSKEQEMNNSSRKSIIKKDDTNLSNKINESNSVNPR